jgi:hypothetical protein
MALSSLDIALAAAQNQLLNLESSPIYTATEVDTLVRLAFQMMRSPEAERQKLQQSVLEIIRTASNRIREEPADEV